MADHNPISYHDFLRVEIHVGTIMQAETFPEAKKPAFRLLIDFGGSIGRKKSSAQITHHYSPENLVGKQILAVTNFPPKQIGPFISEVLVLGVPDEKGNIVLIEPTLAVPAGGRLH